MPEAIGLSKLECRGLTKQIRAVEAEQDDLHANSTAIESIFADFLQFSRHRVKISNVDSAIHNLFIYLSINEFRRFNLVKEFLNQFFASVFELIYYRGVGFFGFRTWQTSARVLQRPCRRRVHAAATEFASPKSGSQLCDEHDSSPSESRSPHAR